MSLVVPLTSRYPLLYLAFLLGNLYQRPQPAKLFMLSIGHFIVAASNLYLMATVPSSLTMMNVTNAICHFLFGLGIQYGFESYSFSKPVELWKTVQSPVLIDILMNGLLTLAFVSAYPHDSAQYNFINTTTATYHLVLTLYLMSFLDGKLTRDDRTVMVLAHLLRAGLSVYNSMFLNSNLEMINTAIHGFIAWAMAQHDDGEQVEVLTPATPLEKHVSFRSELVIEETVYVPERISEPIAKKVEIVDMKSLA